MTYDDWKTTPELGPQCADCDDTGCPECRGDLGPDPDDDTPLCNCGTCTPPHFTCIRED